MQTEKSKVGNTKQGAEEHFKKIRIFSQIRDVAFYETVTVGYKKGKFRGKKSFWKIKNESRNLKSSRIAGTQI